MVEGMDVPAQRSMSRRAGAVVDALSELGLEFVLYLPDSTIASALEAVLESAPVAVPVTREEEGIGILGGLALAGRRAILIIQDTGFGNALTALTTFAKAYRVPMLIVAARTGGLYEINSAVSDYAKAVPRYLEAADVLVEALDSRSEPDEWRRRLVAAWKAKDVLHGPVVVLVDLRGEDA